MRLKIKAGSSSLLARRSGQRLKTILKSTPNGCFVLIPIGILFEASSRLGFQGIHLHVFDMKTFEDKNSAVMVHNISKPADSASVTKKSSRKTDGTRFLTPQQIADRWAWHVESIRRAIRQRRLASVVISRRRLVPLAEVERTEVEGLIARVA